MLTIGIYGPDEDFYTLKGMVENLAEGLMIAELDFTAGGEVYLHPGRKALIKVNGKQVGQMGEVHPKVLENFEIPGRAYIAEIELDASLAGCITDQNMFHCHASQR
jgi:phenylalanyl-tRNA synthetase beta chain